MKIYPNTVKNMYALYQEGYSLRDVGKRYGVSGVTVRYHFKKSGLETRNTPKSVNPAAVAEVTAMYADYESGMSIYELADKYFYHPTTVWARLNRAGYKMRTSAEGRRLADERRAA